MPTCWMQLTKRIRMILLTKRCCGEFFEWKVNTTAAVRQGKCMLMAAAAYNPKKILKWKTKKLQADLKALQQNLQTAFVFVVSTCKRITAYCNPAYKKCNYLITEFR